MRVPVVMPQLGLTMTEGSVSSWIKKPGEQVAKGEMLFIVSTDKADMEVESLNEGELAQIVVEPGKAVPVGTVIAYIERPGDERAPGPEQATTETAQAPAVQAKSETAPATPLKGLNSRPVGRGEGPVASPRARRLAKELGVDITRVKPGGAGGRIVEEDIRRFAEASERGSLPKT